MYIPRYGDILLACAYPGMGMHVHTRVTYPGIWGYISMYISRYGDILQGCQVLNSRMRTLSIFLCSSLVILHVGVL